MTTIVTDGRSMAGDGRVSIGSRIITDHMVKVRQLSDGRVVGFCGETSSFEAIVQWLEEGHPDQALGLDEDFEALVLAADGTVQHIDHTASPTPADVPAGIGSGGRLAVGAMLAGASAREAVHLATRRDMASGGRITECTPTMKD